MVKNNIGTTNYKTNLWVVVGVALVVGLFAGIVGAGISGNIVSDPNSTSNSSGGGGGGGGSGITKTLSLNKTVSFIINGDTYQMIATSIDNVNGKLVFWAKNVRINIAKPFVVYEGQSVMFDSSNILDANTKPLKVHLSGISECSVLGFFPYPCAKVIISDETIATCTDSDGGPNYYDKGTLKLARQDGKLFNYTDTCYGDFLNEYTCKYASIDLDNCTSGCNIDTQYTCPNGCSDGACIGEANETIVEVTYQGVLSMLSKCSIEVDYRSSDSSLHTCNIACGKVNKSCVDGEVMLYVNGSDVRKMINCVTSAEQWSQSLGVSCRCCSA